MFILRQTSVKMAVLLHKQAKVPFIMIIAVASRIRIKTISDRFGFLVDLRCTAKLKTNGTFACL